MPTWRKLYVKATESLDINAMPDDFHRLLWVMLPLGLDREGRGIDNPSWVKAKIMPLRSDITSDDIATAMAWFQSRDMIRRYEVDNRAYFYLPTFHTYQGNTSREAVSDYPPPPDELLQSSRNGHVMVTQSSSTDVDVDANADVDADVDADTGAAAPEQKTLSGQGVALALRLYGDNVFSCDELEALEECEQRVGIDKTTEALRWAHNKNITKMRTICTTAEGWIVHKGNGSGGATGPPDEMDGWREVLEKEQHGANGNQTGNRQTHNDPSGVFSSF